METLLIAVTFGAIAAGIGWYVRRSIQSGTIGFSLREDEQFRFNQSDDPFTFWIAVSFAIFFGLFALTIFAIMVVRMIFSL